MAINKICESFEAAVSGIKDGSTILVSGFGGAGMPTELLNALREQGASELTIVSNNAGVGKEGIGGLLLDGRVKKLYVHIQDQVVQLYSKKCGQRGK